MSQSRPVVSSTTPSSPIFDPATGSITFAWLKWFQNIQQVINASLDQNGNFIGILNPAITIIGRDGTLGGILLNIDATGVLTSDGIDFSRIYVNQNIDFIADGVGSPITGGKVAFAAMVASGPSTGQILVFNGTVWLPHAAAQSIGKIAHEWLDSYDSGSGNFTQSQPAFSDISGIVAPAQLPTPTPTTLGGVESAGPVSHQWVNAINTTGAVGLSQPAFTDISGNLASGQMPAGGFSGTVPLAKLTTLGADGSMTIVNGQVTAVVNPT